MVGGGFLEQGGEGLAGPVQFAAHGIGGLVGQGRHLFVA
jgi:hypothetical protein